MKTLIIFLMLLSCLCHASDVIVLTSGEKIEGDVIHYKAGKVTILLPDGLSTNGAIDSIAESTERPQPLIEVPRLSSMDGDSTFMTSCFIYQFRNLK